MTSGLIGIRAPGANERVRKLDAETFDKFLLDMTRGTAETATPRVYEGQWYTRPDGTLIGVRMSLRHGLTVDIFDSGGHAALRPGVRMHRVD
jgi:hypothetical protein